MYQERYPLVSVITGYYNRTRGLKESVQSILDQTYPNIEYIIFDDCSTDGTYDLLKEFSKDPRVKLIRHETNMGFTKGMIYAADQARGEYLTVHGAGDISYSSRVEKQVDVLNKKSDIVVVGCFYNNYNLVTATEEKVRMKSYFNRDEVFLKTPISQGGSMFRASQYRTVGGYNFIFKYVQDGDLWLRLTTLGNIYVIQEVLYKRIVFADGVSFNTKKTIEQSKYSLFARYLYKIPFDDQLKLIEKCAKEGIHSIIPYNNLVIQKKLFKKFHSVLNVQDSKNLLEFVQYSSGFYNAYYRLIIYCFQIKVFKKLFHFIQYQIYKPLKRKF